ncbi:cache domain-containing protein [Paenibacillus germinis]|nr:cache domain-containing protein [Paenibacillus germinis]
MRLIHTMLNFFDYRNQIKKKLIYIVKSNIENYMNEIEKITKAPDYSTEIQQTLQSLKYKVGIQRKEAEEKLFNTVDVLIGLRSDIVGIYIFDDTNNKYYKTSRSDITPFYSFVDQPSFRRMKELKGERVIIPTHKADYYVTQTPRYIFSIGRSILSKENKEEIGIMYVDLDLDVIRKIVSPLQNNNNQFYILDGDRNLVYSNDQEGLGEPFQSSWLPPSFLV